MQHQRAGGSSCATSAVPAAQLEFLRGAGATHGQGFHLARPMPAADFTKLVRA